MKHPLLRTLQLGALLIALAVPAFAQESKRGFFEGDLAGGGKILFFAENNSEISAYVFEAALGGGGSIGSAVVEENGAFTLTTTSGETISGALSSTAVTGTFRGGAITAKISEMFGDGSAIAGRFKGTADSDENDDHIDLTVLVTPHGDVFVVGNRGSTFFGGFGPITVEIDDRDEPGPGGARRPRDEDKRNIGHKKHRHQEDFKGNFTIRIGSTTLRGKFDFRHGKLRGDFDFEGFKFRFDLDRDSSDNHLGNISTRAFVNNTPQGQLIAGFIITGGPKLLLIRALGPSLKAQGVTDPVLTDPVVTLFRDGNQIARNDNWQSNANASNIIATTIPPQNSREAAVLVRLEAGAYTAVVNGADNGTGVALVEVYEIKID